MGRRRDAIEVLAGVAIGVLGIAMATGAAGMLVAWANPAWAGVAEVIGWVAVLLGGVAIALLLLVAALHLVRALLRATRVLPQVAPAEHDDAVVWRVEIEGVEQRVCAYASPTGIQVFVDDQPTDVVWSGSRGAFTVADHRAELTRAAHKGSMSEWVAFWTTVVVAMLLLAPPGAFWLPGAGIDLQLKVGGRVVPLRTGAVAVRS
jgi:hypothetical protein